jgi:hypothetical protein
MTIDETVSKQAEQIISNLIYLGCSESDIKAIRAIFDRADKKAKKMQARLDVIEAANKRKQEFHYGGTN